MSSPRRPKCRSKVIPCPAGDRCPEHRGLVNAITQAAQDQDLGRFLQLKDEEATKEELLKKAQFLSQVTIKKNRKGETIVKLPPFEKEVASFTLPSKSILHTNEVTFSRTQKQQLVIPPIHPADAVDKNMRIIPNSQKFFFAGSGMKSKREEFAEAVEETYDGNVKVNYHHAGDVMIDGIEITDDYKNRGVEAHVLASLVLDNRVDLYDFYGTDNLDYETYKAAGFEPNPHYWAGQTHPVTGVKYPDTQTLKDLNEWDTNPNKEFYSGLYSTKYNAEYPYVRLKGGQRFTDVPFKVAPKFNKEERKRIWDLHTERDSKLLQARQNGTTDIS